MKNKILHAVEAINILKEAEGHYKDFRLGITYNNKDTFVQIWILQNHEEVIKMFEEMFGESEKSIDYTYPGLGMQYRKIQGEGYKIELRWHK